MKIGEEVLFFKSDNGTARVTLTGFDRFTLREERRGRIFERELDLAGLYLGLRLRGRRLAPQPDHPDMDIIVKRFAHLAPYRFQVADILRPYLMGLLAAFIREHRGYEQYDEIILTKAGLTEEKLMEYKIDSLILNNNLCIRDGKLLLSDATTQGGEYRFTFTPGEDALQHADGARYAVSDKLQHRLQATFERMQREAAQVNGCPSGESTKGDKALFVIDAPTRKVGITALEPEIYDNLQVMRFSLQPHCYRMLMVQKDTGEITECYGVLNQMLFALRIHQPPYQAQLNDPTLLFQEDWLTPEQALQLAGCAEQQGEAYLAAALRQSFGLQTEQDCELFYKTEEHGDTAFRETVSCPPVERQVKNVGDIRLLRIFGKKMRHEDRSYRLLCRVNGHYTECMWSPADANQLQAVEYFHEICYLLTDRQSHQLAQTVKALAEQFIPEKRVVTTRQTLSYGKAAGADRFRFYHRLKTYVRVPEDVTAVLGDRFLAEVERDRLVIEEGHNPLALLDMEAERDKRLDTVFLPDSVQVIAAKAFEHCDRLRTLYLPAGLKEVGCNAFLGCSPADIYYPGSILDFAAMKIESYPDLQRVHCKDGCFDFTQQTVISAFPYDGTAEEWRKCYGSHWLNRRAERIVCKDEIINLR